MRFELSHDIVARQVFDKASAEAQTRRKIEKYIHDRHAMYRERKALLTQDDLEYVRPYLDAIKPDPEELAFIGESERAIRRRRNRLRLTVAGVMAVLVAATASSVVQRSEAQRQAQQATTRQLIASAGNALEDGTLDLAGLLAREAALASSSAAARSPLLTWHLRTARIRGYLRPSNRPVSAVAFSPDGTMLATGSWVNGIAIYSMSPNVHQVHALGVHTDDVTGVAFSPDGATLASCSSDSTIILWDARTAELRVRLRDSAEVNAVAFSPDSRLLASALGNGEVVVRNVADGKVITRWQAHQGNNANSVAFSPNGQSVVSGGLDGAVTLRNVGASKTIWTVFRYISGSINAVVFSRDGSRIAAATRIGDVHVLDTKSGRETGSFTRLVSAVASSLALSADGRTLALGSWDGTVVQWDMERPGPPSLRGLNPRAAVESGQRRGPALTGHTSPVLAVAYSRFASVMASASEDGAVILWDVSRRPLLHASLVGSENGSFGVAFSPDSRLLASVGMDGAVRLWSAPFSEQEPPRVLRDQRGILRSVAFSPSGSLIAAAGDSGVGLWDLTASLPGFQLLPVNGVRVEAVAFSLDGELLASGGSDTVITLWDVATRRSRTNLIGHKHQITGLAFSPDGKWLASSSIDRRAILWGLQDQQEVPLLGTDRPIVSLAFSPDSKTLAAASGEGLLLQWDLQDFLWRGLPRSYGPSPIDGVAFSPDGQSIATSTRDGTVMMWDVARNQLRGEPLRSQAIPLGGCTATPCSTHGIAFSPDGNWLAAANIDGSVAVWNLKTALLLRRVCSVVGRNLLPNEWQQYIGNSDFRETCSPAELQPDGPAKGSQR